MSRGTRCYGVAVTIIGMALTVGCQSVAVPGKHTAACSKAKFTTSTDADGRVWVLREGEKKAEKHIAMVGAGPGGATMKALSRDTVVEYLGQKRGFKTAMDDGRLWVFPAGSAIEMPEKHVTLVGAGPLGSTIKAPDRSVAMAYLATKPGFSVELDDDGRLWVFEADAAMERPEKHITLVGAGPRGMTVKSLNRSTALAYLATKTGFSVVVDEDGRLWVFRGEAGEMPEKHVTRVGAGPLGTTVKAIDRDTLAAYLAAR